MFFSCVFHPFLRAVTAASLQQKMSVRRAAAFVTLLQAARGGMPWAFEWDSAFAINSATAARALI